MSAVLALGAALAAAGAAALVPAVAECPRAAASAASVDTALPQWWMHRFQWLLACAAGAGAWVFVGGAPGVVAAGLAAVACWRAIARAESEPERRRREAVGADLPVLVHLVAIGLRAGVDPITAVGLATAALPGPASAQVAEVLAPHRLGLEPDRLWERLSAVPGLESLGRALARSGDSGASVVTVIDRLSVELSRQRRAEVEDRARQVGVKAAVPLGLCLLPAFLLVGIVPLVGGLVSSLEL